ncbi:hypothetical protein STAS_26578 [Striga asiatica]|uniref:DUF4283 domain-containing protein n=1 Tax=Striga asiatica TaxID=4170 RepID=A0A5A7QZC3_STRAF|nr:hypothetical protein STAS_26578 [Striga asiatica]
MSSLRQPNPSGDPIALTVASVNTGLSSEAPKEPPVTAQPEVVGFDAEFSQTAAAALNTAPSSPRASPLEPPFFPSPLTSTATLPSSIPTQTIQSGPNQTQPGVYLVQPLQNGPNPAQPANSAFGPSYLSAAQKTVPPEPLSYGSISLSSSIPEVLFSPPEVSKMSEDLKYALIGKFSFGKPSNEAIRSKLTLLGFTGCKIFFLHAIHVLIKVDDPNTSTKLWLKRKISILNFPMRIFKWSADFDFKKEPPIAPDMMTIRPAKINKGKNPHIEPSPHISPPSSALPSSARPSLALDPTPSDLRPLNGKAPPNPSLLGPVPSLTQIPGPSSFLEAGPGNMPDSLDPGSPKPN